MGLESEVVVTKYIDASRIAQKVLEQMVALIAPGKSCVSLCIAGDQMISTLTAASGYKKLEKGIAFPTCICVNNVVAHYSPLESEDTIVLASGDAVSM